MRTVVLAVAAGLTLTACNGGMTDAADRSGPDRLPGKQALEPAGGGGGRVTIDRGLHVPWGIAKLPNGDALVAERTTARIIRIYADGRDPKRVMTVPGVDTNAGEGGLLGLAVGPNYRNSKLVYAYFTSDNDNRIVRFTLKDEKLDPILTGLARASIHNGGRIAFGPDGKLYAGVGDAGDTSHAQRRSSLNGKILRMNKGGGIPDDNPFNSRVWTLGHRNVQGLTWDKNGRMWATEFGQSQFDEVNRILKGRNYGWPNVEGRGDTQNGTYKNPKVTWSTDEASPSGIAAAGGYLWVAALRGQCLWRIKINGKDLGEPRRFLHERYGRLRTVVNMPNGRLWIATSNRDGRIAPRPGDDRIVSLKEL